MSDDKISDSNKVSLKNKELLSMAIKDDECVFLEPTCVDGGLYMLSLTENQLKIICKSLIDYQKHRYINRIKYKSVNSIQSRKRKHILEKKFFVYNEEVFKKIFEKKEIAKKKEILKKEGGLSLADMYIEDKVVHIVDKEKLDSFIFKDFIYERYDIKFEIEKGTEDFKIYRTMTKDIYIEFSKWCDQNSKTKVGRNNFYFHLNNIFLKNNVYYFGLKLK